MSNDRERASRAAEPVPLRFMTLRELRQGTPPGDGRLTPARGRPRVMLRTLRA